ncbi:MAG: reverse transcriptase/maturase family protein [Chromatiales bacterium]|nr:reverse transcriptase/maturase family protein [Chromatiales bacterium]
MVACNGGNWSNGANAGPFYLNVNNAPSNSNTNIGARLANDDRQMPDAPRGAGQCVSFGAAIPTLGVEDAQARAADGSVARADLGADTLWAQICDIENLYAGYHAARRGKRYARDVMAFAERAEARLARLQDQLIGETWRPSEPRRFWVRDPKWREITAPPFADRIVHHALVRVVEPLFERRFIHDSYACRVGRGNQAAVQRVQQFLRRARRRWGEGVYVVKVDIRRYFASLDHAIVMAAIERVMDELLVQRLWRTVLGGYGFAGVGLPVGALTSQLVANVVLDILDHRVKDEWGEPFYVRYMDDLVLIVPNKSHARRRLADIARVAESLQLRLNPKSTLYPWPRGIDFCGYRIWPTHILPRKRNMRRLRQRLRRAAHDYAGGRCTLGEVREVVMSARAYCRHCSARTALRTTLSEIRL